jgi:hypothetical protein
MNTPLTTLSAVAPAKADHQSLLTIPRLRSGFTLIALALGFFALCPVAQAVSPPPDGGYSGGNTAEGQGALLSLTTGTYNTAAGLFSLLSLTDGKFCTGIGAGTLLANTADENTATGAGALLSNSTGTGNTANGAFALFSNTIGIQNTATGDAALFSNTTGLNNTATGFAALNQNTTGNFNTANGYGALGFNTTGGGNTADGFFALDANIDGGNNTAIGDSALYFNFGSQNTATGAGALFNNTTGGDNTATGFQALANTVGEKNTAVGSLALFNTTITGGTGNIALGYNAGSNLTSGSNNIYLGSLGVATESTTIRIGESGVHDRAFIRGIRGVTTGVNNAVPVLIDGAGQLGTTSSSRRYKKDIKAMDQASKAILSLKPVTFHYKSDTKDTPQFGLIAEEVAEVNPDLVVRDENGEIYTVRYDQVNAMLLNEFLKEHKTVQEQGATIAELKKDFRATVAQLTARLEEQAAQIQKVSAHLEMKKPAPQMAANHP